MVLMIIDRLLTGFSTGVLLGYWVAGIATEKHRGKNETALEWVDADWEEVD